MRDLSLSVLDIVQNSITAKARLIRIIIKENPDNKTLLLCVEDDGVGMTGEQLKMAAEPYYTTKTSGKSGMGIPRLKAAAERTGGEFALSSEPGCGTSIRCIFNTASDAMMPIGELDKTIALLCCCNPNTDFIYETSVADRSFLLDTREIKALLGDVSIGNVKVVRFITEYLREQETILHGGAISNENT